MAAVSVLPMTNLEAMGSLLSVDEKSDEEQSYNSFKAYKCVWSEHFGHLFCITYMGVSRPSLLIESTDSMIIMKYINLYNYMHSVVVANSK